MRRKEVRWGLQDEGVAWWLTGSTRAAGCTLVWASIGEGGERRHLGFNCTRTSTSYSTATSKPVLQYVSKCLAGATSAWLTSVYPPSTLRPSPPTLSSVIQPTNSTRNAVLEVSTASYPASPSPLTHRPQRTHRSFTTQLQSVAGQAASTVQGATQQIDLNSTGKSLSQGFATLSQTVREKTGQTQQDDVTELPQEYLDLERRVDGLRAAHVKLLRVAKAFEGHYDYPVNLGESAQEIGGSLAHNLSAWAATATKGESFILIPWVGQPLTRFPPPNRHPLAATPSRRGACFPILTLPSEPLTDPVRPPAAPGAEARRSAKDAPARPLARRRLGRRRGRTRPPRQRPQDVRRHAGQGRHRKD